MLANCVRIKKKKNRQAIRTMSDIVRGLEERFYEFEETTKDLHLFVITYTQFDMLIAELREDVEKAMFYMDSVRAMLGQLSLGHLGPTVIPPKELKHILTDIEQKIPKYLTLPKPVENIWYYYKTLTCLTVVKNKRFITLVNLPLLDINTQFELYQVHNIPMPFNQTELLAKYQLETTTLAVNVKHTNFVLLTATEMALCSSPQITFCSISSPVYTLGESRLCVISLFENDKRAITENCQIRVQLRTILPQAVYIPDGNWIIVAVESIEFTIMCLEEENYHIVTSPPVFTLHLKETCQAFAAPMNLPAYYHSRSIYKRVEQRRALMSLISGNISGFSLWDPFDKFLNTTDIKRIHEYAKLADISDMTIDNLVDELNDLRDVPKIIDKKGILDSVGGIGFPLVVVCILLTLGVIIYQQRKKICSAAIVRIMGAGTSRTAGVSKDVENVPERVVDTNDQPRHGESEDNSLGQSRPMVVELQNS